MSGTYFTSTRAQLDMCAEIQDDYSTPTTFGAIVMGVWIQQSKKMHSACTLVRTVPFGCHLLHLIASRVWYRVCNPMWEKKLLEDVCLSGWRSESRQDSMNGRVILQDVEVRELSYFQRGTGLFSTFAEICVIYPRIHPFSWRGDTSPIMISCDAIYFI